MRKGIISIILCFFLFSAIYPTDNAVIIVTKPIENSVWKVGQTMRIAWRTEGEPKLPVKLYLKYVNGPVLYRIGGCGYSINSSLGSTGNILWKIPLNLFKNMKPQNPLSRIKKVCIRVRTCDNSLIGDSRSFIIKPFIIKVPKKN
ncbi:MAG: hypothetical protein ABFR75_12130 [Acidobacteriota bacterium]